MMAGMRWFTLLMVMLLVPLSGMAASGVESRTLGFFEQSMEMPKELKKKPEGFLEGVLVRMKKGLWSNRAVREAMLEDLRAWTDIDPLSSGGARALLLRARAHQADGDLAGMAMSVLRLHALFPGSREAAAGKKMMLEKTQHLSEADRKSLQALVARQYRGKAANRWAAMIRRAASDGPSLLDDALIRECRVYLSHFRTHPEAPGVHHALADILARHDAMVARVEYLALAHAYPSSAHAGWGLVKAADIIRDRKSGGEEAVALYRQAISKYSKSSAARAAYLGLAAAYRDHLKDRSRAEKTLAELVRRYPGTREAGEGNEALAEMYERDKQVAKAVATYRRMPKVTRDKELIRKALARAARLADGKLNDPRSVVAIDREICALLPKSEECAEAYFRSGEVYEHKLNQPAKAIQAYRQVAKRFPKHPLARKAASRADRLAQGKRGFSLF